MHLSNSKIKCPRCGTKILKIVVKVTQGKCNNCGYMIAGSLSNFSSVAVKSQAVTV